MSGSAWPQADALFRSDSRWLGSDDAYSVALSPGRTLWLFGDTFVDGSSRAKATFIRNSVGIQTGSDPASASIKFFWKPGPDSYFEAPEGTWYWPLHGVMAGGSLIVFMMLVRAPGGGAGGGTGAIDDWRRLGALGFFDVFGWAALRVTNPDDQPDAWRVETLCVRRDPIVLGASVFTDGDAIVAYGWDSAKSITMARWTDGNVHNEPEWWSGDVWSRDATPAIVIESGATEFSVHRDGRTGTWWQTQMIPKSQSLALRRADRCEGPWSAPQEVFIPEETSRDGVFVYAGKAHPQFSGHDLIVTYASNATADVCLADQSIYYPRFVRVHL